MSRTTGFAPGKEMLGRIVAMLTRLVDRFDTDEVRVRAESSPFSTIVPIIVLELVLDVF